MWIMGIKLGQCYGVGFLYVDNYVDIVDMSEYYLGDIIFAIKCNNLY